jgi:hypothetical protein
MKFTEMLKHGIKGGIEVGAKVQALGVLEGVPIVSNILAGCAVIQAVIEERDDVEESLDEVKDTVGLVAPVVDMVGKATENAVVDDKGLNDNLAAVSGVLEEIFEVVESFDKKGHAGKLISAAVAVNSESNEPKEFVELVNKLKERLDKLSLAITGKNYMMLLHLDAKMDQLAQGMVLTQAIANQQTGVLLNNQQIVQENQKLLLGKNVQEERIEVMEEINIDASEIVIEEEPFAKGSFGSIHKARWEGQEGEFCRTM